MAAKPIAATLGGAGRLLFIATILTGSFLLFLVQPMVARMALPRLGGAPAVWNSAMLVYQTLLLGGYAYAHWLGRAAPRTQAVIHVGVSRARGDLAAARPHRGRDADPRLAGAVGAVAAGRLHRAAVLRRSARRRR